MATKALHGGCACGATTYKSTAPPQHLDACYCNVCQRISGAPMVAWAGIDRSALVFHGTIGTVQIMHFASRSFCSTCGGTLTIQYDCYPNKTHVAAATIQASDWDLPPMGVHIFTKFKPPWYQIADDGIPRYEEFDPEFERLLQTHQERRC